MKYNSIILDILLNTHVISILNAKNQVDLGKITKLLKAQCPGNFALAWRYPNKKLVFFDEISESILQDVVKIIFENEQEKLEWMLRYG